MSSFLSPPSTTDLLIPRKQSNAKKTAAVAAAAAVVVFCPSGSARLPPPRSIPNEHTYLLSGWPETPSPVGTPEIEINPFAFQSDRLDTHLPLDSGSDTPAWSDASTHSTTSSSASTVSLDDRRGTSRRRSLRPLVKRASSDYDQSMSFPQAFDTSLGTRFESSTCGPVIERMVSDPGLQACHPFSLLLTTSNGFFHSLRGSPGALPLNDVLGTACTTDRDACGALADLMASRLTASDACGLELDKHNALAIEALQGLQNFRLMRDVGCLTLQDPILDLNTTHLNISTSDHQPTKASPNTSARRPSGLPNSTDPMGANTSSYLPTRPTGPTSLNYCFQAAANSTNPDDLVSPLFGFTLNKEIRCQAVITNSLFWSKTAVLLLLAHWNRVTQRDPTKL